MKMLKAICTATVLALALSVPVCAGEILTPGVSLAPNKPVVTEPAPIKIVTFGGASAAPGDAETPILAGLLMAILSIF